jgi:hypothetical protein
MGGTGFRCCAKNFKAVRAEEAMVQLFRTKLFAMVGNEVVRPARFSVTDFTS